MGKPLPSPLDSAHGFLSPQQEYKAPDGRTYWSHSVTKQSRWDKPDDLKTPFEVGVFRVLEGS
jgi:hypothetical protein